MDTAWEQRYGAAAKKDVLPDLAALVGGGVEDWVNNWEASSDEDLPVETVAEVAEVKRREVPLRVPGPLSSPEKEEENTRDRLSRRKPPK